MNGGDWDEEDDVHTTFIVVKCSTRIQAKHSVDTLFCFEK